MGFFLLKMHVVVNMIHAETMIPITARAVAEFNLRVVSVCFAADGALTRVWAILPLFLDALPCPVEVHHRAGALLTLFAEKASPTVPGEEEVDEKQDQGNQVRREQRPIENHFID